MVSPQVQELYMLVEYLSTNVDDAWRRRVENALINQGDTHIYIYSQNGDDGIGNVLPQSDWELRLDHLNSRGLRPVMWLMADDSPNLASKPLSYHKSHNSEMVSRFDDKVDGYVIGLEVDEYCCENEWDTICQATYDYCNGTWSGPLLTRQAEKNLVAVTDLLGRPTQIIKISFYYLHTAIEA